jgi:hypothetical protein
MFSARIYNDSSVTDADSVKAIFYVDGNNGTVFEEIVDIPFIAKQGYFDAACSNSWTAQDRGEYVLRVSAEPSISQGDANYENNEATQAFGIGLCLADLDGDGTVGSKDLLIMKIEYNRKGCNPLVQEKCCRADITGDGKVNSADLLAMKREYGRTGCVERTLPCAF